MVRAGDNATWAIDADPLTGWWAVRNGVRTNGHALEIRWCVDAAAVDHTPAIHVKSPTGGIWYRWLGPNSWRKLTIRDPSTGIGPT